MNSALQAAISWLSWSLIVAAAFAVVFLTFKALRKRQCPQCATSLPRIRRPADKHEALLGGWTCRGCGARLDSSGRLRTAA